MYGSILQEQAVEAGRFDSLAEGPRRALLSHVPHAVAAVLDQVNACKLADTFSELTEPLAKFAVSALSSSGQVAEAETVCTSVLDFLCCTHPRDSQLLFPLEHDGEANTFKRRCLEHSSIVYHLKRCNARISRGNLDGAETDAFHMYMKRQLWGRRKPKAPRAHGRGRGARDCTCLYRCVRRQSRQRGLGAYYGGGLRTRLARECFLTPYPICTANQGRFLRGARLARCFWGLRIFQLVPKKSIPVHISPVNVCSSEVVEWHGTELSIRY